MKILIGIRMADMAKDRKVDETTLSIRWLCNREKSKVLKRDM